MMADPISPSPQSCGASASLYHCHTSVGSIYGAFGSGAWLAFIAHASKQQFYIWLTAFFLRRLLDICTADWFHHVSCFRIGGHHTAWDWWAAPESPLIPIFPEPVCGLLDSVIFPEITVGEGCWAEQADKIRAMEIRVDNKNVFIYLTTSMVNPMHKYIRHILR